MNANQQGVTRIGTLRRSLFLAKNCAWNGLVREVTAKYEHSDEMVNAPEVYEALICAVRELGQQDQDFPLGAPALSRLDRLFKARLTDRHEAQTTPSAIDDYTHPDGVL